MFKTKSSRSMHSLKSESEITFDFQAPEQLPSTVFEELLPFICRKFNCEHDIYVKRINVQDTSQRFKKADVPFKAKRPVEVELKFIPDSGMSVFQELMTADDNSNVIVLDACYDTRNRLIEVILYNLSFVPRMIMQVIVALAHNYTHLNKITIRRCSIRGEIIYELNKLLCFNYLTEVCLDDTFLPEQNFSYLLEEPSSLKNVSLARCRICDDVCESIVSKLNYQSSAEKHLLLLNLSGNYITDVGARYVALMLRTNRHLRYLNLAGNQITDDGAFAILNVLLEFSLTYDEITDKRKRLFTYLKSKKALVAKYLSQADVAFLEKSSVISRKSGLKRVHSSMPRVASAVSNIVSVSANAELFANKMMDKFEDPFRQSKVTIKNGWCYCIGNKTLSYLNLAYNDLSYLSVKKVLEVLIYHDTVKKVAEGGLQRIVIEGNRMPEACQEYDTISMLLNKHLQDGNLGGRRKSQISKKSNTRK